MFVGIYLGPILFLVFFWGVFIKIIRIVKEKRITSIADFIATRYGRDHNLAIIITLVAFVGIIPYVALQLKAIASTFELDRKSTRLNSSHVRISYAVFCLKKKK